MFEDVVIDGYRYRSATLGDHQAVVHISTDVYGGLDPLPTGYCDYLREDDRHLFVCEEVSTGRVVGFQMLYLLDGGATAVGQCLRVARGFRGRLIADTLKAHSVRQLGRVYADFLDRTLIVTVNQPRYATKKATSRRLPAGLLTKEQYLTGYCQLGSDDRDKHRDPSTDASLVVEEVSKSHAVQLLSSIHVTTTLLFHRHATVASQPYPVTSRNLDELLSGTVVLVSRDVSLAADDGVVALSFARRYQAPRAPSCEVSFYGASEDELLRHVLHHIRSATRHFPLEKLYLAVAFPVVLNKHTVYEGLTSRAKLSFISKDQDFYTMIMKTKACL